MMMGTTSTPWKSCSATPSSEGLTGPWQRLAAYFSCGCKAGGARCGHLGVGHVHRTHMVILTCSVLSPNQVARFGPTRRGQFGSLRCALGPIASPIARGVSDRRAQGSARVVAQTRRCRRGAAGSLPG